MSVFLKLYVFSSTTGKAWWITGWERGQQTGQVNVQDIGLYKSNDAPVSCRYITAHSTALKGHLFTVKNQLELFLCPITIIISFCDWYLEFTPNYTQSRLPRNSFLHCLCVRACAICMINCLNTFFWPTASRERIYNSIDSHHQPCIFVGLFHASNFQTCKRKNAQKNHRANLCCRKACPQ